jgi:hypothetical protein
MPMEIIQRDFRKPQLEGVGEALPLPTPEVRAALAAAEAKTVALADRQLSVKEIQEAQVLEVMQAVAVVVLVHQGQHQQQVLAV